MIILSAKDIKKEYGTDVILEGITFSVNEGERIGLVGPNGAGKTTLLEMLAGNIDPSSGSIFVSRDTNIGYLKQRDSFTGDGTVIEEMEEIFRPLMDMENEMNRISHLAPGLSGADQKEMLEQYEDLREEFEQRGGYRFRSDVRGILKSMAFTEDYFDKPVSQLSGGERTRLALAALLLKNPDILFLDEPTNHLDIGTLKWLEQYLASYRGTIIVVSHDRYFLNETVTRILDIERGKLRSYDGNYDEYASRKKEIREEELRRYKNQQAEIARQEDMVRRMKQRGTEKLAKRAASREKKLAAIDRLSAPEAEVGKMKIHFREKFKSGNDVLFAEDLAKSFGYGMNEKKLFENVGFDIKRGERICIVGANGIGKTTLIRMITGELKPNAGYIKKGHNVEIGYYDQEQRLLNEDNTVFDEMKDAYHLYTDTEMRSILGRFLFRGDDVFLPIRALSGGEKARLSLLKLMLSGANLLLLDEPTNHLDIDSKEIFEDALMEFPGTSIIISHDRYLLGKVPTRIMELERGGLTEYLGKYDYYIEKKQQIESGKKYLDSLKESGAGAAGTGAAVSGAAGSGAAVSGAAGTGAAGAGFGTKGIHGNGSAGNAGGGVQGRDADGSLLYVGNGKAEGNELTRAVIPGSPEDRRLKKEAEAARRRRERELAQLEQEIEELEIRIHDIEEEMCQEDVLSDYLRLDALGEELAQTKDKLEDCYGRWMQEDE